MPVSVPICDVLVPVLGRPWNAAPLAESLAASTDRARLIFVVSMSDSDEQFEACAATGAAVLNVEWRPGPGDYARKINYAYQVSGEGGEWGQAPAPLVLLAADDLRFRPGWLETVEAITEEYDCGVIGTNDLGNPEVARGRHSTHPVVRRCYIDQFGGVMGEPGMVYWPGYDHQCVDNELCETAQARGCYAHAHDAVIEHLHPLWGKGESDETYRKGLARGQADFRLLRERRKLWSRAEAIV